MTHAPLYARGYARTAGCRRRWRGAVVLGLLVPLLAGLLAACGSSSSGTPYGPEGPGGIPVDAVQFTVRDTAGLPVVGATVYLVPNTAVDDTLFDGAAVLDGSAEDKDEPIEDALRRAGTAFPQAVTGADGAALLQSVPGGTYFPYVMPSQGDAEHLPGGDISRLAVAASTFLGQRKDIVLSSSPSPTSGYRGTTICLRCHPAYETVKTHAHRLGFTVPGDLTSLQDASRYPDFDGQWQLFLDAAAYTGGTPIYFFDYDPAGGASRFSTTLTDPRPGEAVSVIAWLWRHTGSGDYRITLENIANPADPMSPWTLQVELTYGGALARQINLVAVPGREGRYPLLQWQIEGDDAYYDATRWIFRDYHLDLFWDPAVPAFRMPPADATFEGNCAACHFNGFERYQDAGTNEWLARAVPDIEGAFDIDGDGRLDEINIGCESCHGPGGDHIAWLGTTPPASQRARYIVTPQNLGASRQIMICGRCHDRVIGFGSNPNNEPLSASDAMLPVGGSREAFLAAHADRKGPALSDYWPDRFHSRSNYQQYSDFLKGNMHRNGRVLTVCTDCHASHGDGPFTAHLKYDPADPSSKLCLDCHLVADLGAHTAATSGFDHGSLTISCTDCHQDEIAKSGAGRYGRTIATPTGAPSDEDIVFWENDVSSHLFIGVPSKSNPGVAGVVPGRAMPIPYTDACGVCHNVAGLPKPGLDLEALAIPVDGD